jgi:cobalt/nickel transport system permease protein
MHAPDGFLDPVTAVATAGMAVGAVSFALRQTQRQLDERGVPVAGVTAAFVFAAQMVNFPIGAGTSGHLLGATLAAVLLGPSVGVVVVTVVVVVQALLLADGGLSALGYNVLNMAVVPGFGGFALYQLFRRVLPATSGGVVAATGLASGASVVLAAAAFSVEWLFGATAPVPFDTVFGAMVGVHSIIGIGEGVISGLAVGAVLAARPDLVFGARDLDPGTLRAVRAVPLRTFVLAAGLTAVAVAAVVSQFAVDDPDGLERVAENEGFAQSGSDHALADGPFADYATDGIDNESVSLAVAGITGVVVTLAVAAGMLRATVAGRARSDTAGIAP